MRSFSGIGQYVPAVSPVHSLDAAAKLGVVVAFTVGLFLVDGFSGLAAMGAAIALAVLVSRVPVRAVARGLGAVGLILVFTILANALRWDPATVALVRIGSLAVDAAGLRTGLFFAVRIVLLVTGTSLLTLTTSPVELTGGIERALGPLRRVGVPVGELAMTLTIALRFIPTTWEEADQIITAQQARGASFDAGGPLARARAYTPVLLPLFYRLFRRADSLATAMEARCYSGSAVRTRLHDARMGTGDWVVLVASASALIAAGWLL
ncbi:MAG: energy-coupling factor transporter transmembrane protein EcfT [Coriobacteriia bacterium]|nr:energy-coupling factor transporter transmembrane protein EcfT [Coriobacteriia bacterium]